MKTLKNMVIELTSSKWIICQSWDATLISICHF